MLIIASALHSCMNSRSAPVAPGTQQALNTCVLFEKQNKTCAVCPPSEPKLQDSRAFGLVCCYVACLGDILMGAPSVPSPRNITESSETSTRWGREGLYHPRRSKQLKIPFGANAAYSLGSGMEVVGEAQRRFFVCFHLNIFGKKQRITDCYVASLFFI